MSRILGMPWGALLVAAACGGALGFALTLQYGFGVAPCQLCLWQRGPLITAGVLALGAAGWRPYGAVTRGLLMACAVLFLADAGLALFHSGVERHWWEFHSSCTGGVLDHTKSIEELREELLGKPVVRCDEISWTLFGFSMANLNVVFSGVMAGVAGRVGCVSYFVRELKKSTGAL